MENFGYLSVLISIVLGLGITNLLYGVAGLVRERKRVRMYWPVPMWMFTLFLVHVQTWWTMFGLMHVTNWKFAQFVVVLMQPVTLFLASALIVPKVSGEGPIDLRAEYFREARWLWGALIGNILASVAKNFMIAGGMTFQDMIAHGVFFAMAAGAIAWNRDAYHRVAAPFALALFLVYVALLFVDLGGYS